MTNNLPPRVVSRCGMTLLELTIVISLLLALVSICFVGARAWKRGGDRTSCILTLRNIQVAARSYQNLYGYNYGGRPYAETGSQDIAQHLYNKGYIEKKLFDQANGTAKCPSGGAYSCPLPDIFPEPGELYMNCSLSSAEDHEPSSHGNW
jgi:prepilin-type N-terminal cleavage/methylation domain-containing protein